MFILYFGLCIFLKLCVVYVSEGPAKYFSELSQRWNVGTKHRPPLCLLSFVIFPPHFPENHFQFVSLLSMPGLSQENPFMIYVVAMAIKPTIEEADQTINSSRNQQCCQTVAKAMWLCWCLSFSLGWRQDWVFLATACIYDWVCCLFMEDCIKDSCALSFSVQMLLMPVNVFRVWRRIWSRSPAEIMIRLINSFLHLRICQYSLDGGGTVENWVPQKLCRCFECCLPL